jgi:hypothetical protein
VSKVGFISSLDAKPDNYTPSYRSRLNTTRLLIIQKQQPLVKQIVSQLRSKYYCKVSEKLKNS